jgi:hypothetical protein
MCVLVLLSVPFLSFFLFSCCIPFLIEYPSIHNFLISCSPELALLCYAIIKFSPHILPPKHLHILGGCSCDWISVYQKMGLLGSMLF